MLQHRWAAPDGVLPTVTSDAARFLAGLHPLGRMGNVWEMVDAMLYLKSAVLVTGDTPLAAFRSG
jgi:hypothetical protein